MLTAGLNCVTVVNVTKYGYVGECVCVCIRVHVCKYTSSWHCFIADTSLSCHSKQNMVYL